MILGVGIRIHLQTKQLTIRSLQANDKEILAKWLASPGLLSFYEGRDKPFDIHKIEERFYKRDDLVTPCIVEYVGRPIGYIQYYEADEHTKSVLTSNASDHILGMDQFIGEGSYWDKGIGHY